jgi:hypothetical protein
MQDNEGTERRSAQRFIPVNDTYLVIRPTFQILGRLKDISSTGLAFEYIPFDSRSNLSSVEVDVFSSEGIKIHLSYLPVEVVYDIKVEKVSFVGLETRRCGVKYGSLTDRQTDTLQTILQNCTQYPIPVTS